SRKEEDGVAQVAKVVVPEGIKQERPEKHTSVMDKWLLEHRAGSSFMPSTNELENTESMFWKAVVEGYVEEEKAGGPYRLSKLARKRIGGLFR
ncbi:MAG: hypothetical protein ACTSWQ_05040, partial [Candidatus Thorarchaeota archaeon]